MAMQQLSVLPRGDMLKPMLLGYDHLGADLLWLQAIQVLGERILQKQDYEWLFHALDVATTLDPHFVAAYDVGGILLTELAGRVGWSNQLLAKGMAANPTAWRLPYMLGFNHFFHQQDYRRAADYLALAARLPGRPAYVPELAARLYVESKNPELALVFLDSLLQQTQDADVRATLERRRGEVMIERHIAGLEEALTQYVRQYGVRPDSLEQLVEGRILAFLPVEPFGGSYRLDAATSRVVSSTHPHGLRLYRPDGVQPFAVASGES